MPFKQLKTQHCCWLTVELQETVYQLRVGAPKVLLLLRCQLCWAPYMPCSINVAASVHAQAVWRLQPAAH